MTWAAATPITSHARRYWKTHKPVLTVHNATEENLVYPALQKFVGQKRESEHLYQETAQADVLVFELDTMLKSGDDASFRETAEKLSGRRLRTH